MWLAEVGDRSTGGTRTVAALTWDGLSSLAAGALSIDLDVKGPNETPQRILLEVPRQLLDPGEIGVVLLSIAPDPVTLLGAKEAGLLAPEPEGVLVPGGQYVEISIMVSNDGGATFAELDEERVRRHPIRLVMYGLRLDALTIPAFQSHPTYVDSDPASGIELLAEAGAWQYVSTMTLQQEPIAEDGTHLVSMEGYLNALSLFAPYDTGDKIPDTVGQSAGGGDSDGDGAGTGGSGGSGGGSGGSGGGSGGAGEGTQGEGIFDADGVEGSVQNSTSTANGIEANTAEVWVDFAFLGDESGTEDWPYNTYAEALAIVDNGGLIKTKTGVSSETVTFAQAVTVTAVGGPVQAGDPSATQLPGLQGAVIAAFTASRSFPPEWHLLGGSRLQTAAQRLTESGVTIVEIPTLDQNSLDGVDIFFGGAPDGTIVTSAEQAALLAFVQAGGGLIAFTERADVNLPYFDPLTSPFGITGVGGDRADTTTISVLGHPVMNGRFGLVDNVVNVYWPEAPGGFNSSPALVLATTVNGEGAILALGTGLGKAVFFNDINFMEDENFFLGGGNGPAIMNAFLYVYNTPVSFHLSFDDGPHALAGSGNNTREVNAALNARGIKAAFFVQTHVSFRGGDPEGQLVIQELHAAGHRIEVHTGSDDDHVAHTIRVSDDAYDANGDEVIDEQDGANALEGDLIRAKTRISALTGRTPTLVRPPFGDTNGAVLSTYAAQNLTMKLWDVVSGDSHSFHTPSTPRQDSIDYIHDQLRNGAGGIVDAFNSGTPRYVVLFHDIKGYTSEELEGHLQEMELIVKEELGPRTIFEDWPPSP